MKLRALIIDDEPLAHKIILEYARDVPFLDISGQYYLATDALAALHGEPVDLIFLDIKMPKLEGLEFLRTLSQRPLVIITSAYSEYALDSFELDVVDYLLKPFRFDRFVKAVQKALELHRLQNPAVTAGGAKPIVPEPPSRQLFIKSGKKHIQVGYDEIFCLESYGNYVKVWLEDKYLLSPGTLSSFEDQVPADTFSRVHKSYVVNRLFIHYVEGNTIVLKNGREVPVGKVYRNVLGELLR
jgi:two-component system, LytTR family, response regulator